MHLSLFGVCALAGFVLAKPTDNYAVHEKRDSIPQGWVKRETLDRRAILPMRIALTQRNLDRGYGKLISILQGWSIDI